MVSTRALRSALGAHTAPPSLLGGLGRESLVVSALLLAAAAIRFPNLWTDPRLTDEWREAGLALQIARGQALPLTNVSAYLGALWNYALAAGFLALGEHPWVPRLVVFAAGALTVLPTYLLARVLGGPWAGLAAGALLATSPLHVLVSSHISWGHCAAPLLTTTACWLAASAAQRSSGPRLALAGAMFGLAAQLHPTVLALVPGLLLYLGLRQRRLLRSRWLPLAASLALLACLNVAVALASDPRAVLNQAQERETRYAAETAGVPATTTARALTNAGQLALMLARLPSGVVLQSNDWRDVLRHPLVWLYAVALAGGTVVAARRGQPLPLYVTLAALPVLALVQPGSYYPIPDARFSMPLLPPLYASLGMALVDSLGPAARATRDPVRARSLRLGGALVALLLALLPLKVLTNYYAGTAEGRARYSATWDAVLEITRQAPPGAPVVIDDRVQRLVADHSTVARGLGHWLEDLGFPTRFAPIDADRPDAALADRHAVYILTCPAYANARARLGLVPLTGAAPGACNVVRAARYP